MTTTWHGVLLDDRSAAMMDAVQALVTASPNPFTISPSQGSYSVSVGASAGTHAGGGAIDISAASLTTTQRDFLVAAMRQVGWAAWLRTPAQGFSYHVHGIAVGCADLSPEAAQQVQAYFAGRNGLRDNGPDDGPRDWVGMTWETYSGDSYVPPSGGSPATVFGQFPGDRSGTFGDFPGGILAGAPTWVLLPDGTPSSTGGWNFRRSQIDSEIFKLHMEPGDSCALSIRSDWLYYNGGSEPISLGYWMIRATGAGSLAVADGWDEDYNYPSVMPTWTDQTLVGSAGDFDYYTVSSGLLDPSHLELDGWPLIRLTCTGAALDITWVGMQVQPGSGYFAVTGETVWSSVQPASTREPANNAANTYDTYFDGDVAKWSVDDTPVLGPTADEDGVRWDDWLGSAESTVDAQSAIDDANVDFARNTSSVTAIAYVSLQFIPAHTDIFNTFPDTWSAVVREGVTYSTAPTKSTLNDYTPPEFTALTDWQATTFEWMDDGTEFLGWHQYGIGSSPTGYEFYVEVMGDAAEVSYSIITSSTDVDLKDVWFEPGDGQLLASGLTTDNFGGSPDPGSTPDNPYLIAIDDAFIGTTDRLAFLRLELDRRFTDQVDQFTVPNGYGPGGEGTTAGLAVIRTSDGAHVAVGQIAAQFRVPPWRYSQPTFTPVLGPAPFIDFDEDPSVTWLRQRQRNDGLGNSITRARGISSQQRSLRQRGYR